MTRLSVLIPVALIISGCTPETTSIPEGEDPIIKFDDDDPQMEKAFKEARSTFKWFWKEVAMDFNRIIPALEVAILKVGFTTDGGSNQPGVEHMWVNGIDFDGVHIKGTLSSQPRWVSHLKEGDAIKVKIEEISDWVAVISGEVYGGYSVQVTRSRFSEEDRAKHDEMWGLEFPDIPTVNLPDNPSEFEPVLAKLLKEQIDKSPDEILNFRDNEGRSLLHLEALYDRSISVSTLLDAGYDRDLKCKRGWLAADYAKKAGWPEIAKQIESHQ